MTSSKKRAKPSVVIVGAGVAGAAAAVELREAGASVTVVEREAQVGGQAGRFGCKATDVCLHCNVCVGQDLLKRAFGPDSGTRVLTSSQVAECRRNDDGDSLELNVTSVRGKTTRLHADYVVAATGYTPFDPSSVGTYGYGLIPNVISGLDAEQAHADGRAPLTRPSDGQPAKRIAFIQCVGSRNEQAYRTPEKTDYCSTVCCSYALRMGRLAKHLNPECQVTVFYMDIQCFGQDFADFYAACRKEMTFVMARPFGLAPLPGGTVAVRYEDQTGGQAKEAEFDLVVLSVGMRPAAGVRDVAEALNLPVDEYGFLGAKSTLRLGAKGEGRVFVAGACEAPMSIAQTVAQARAVAGQIVARCQSQ